MKVWFGGVGDEILFQNIQVPNTQNENLEKGEMQTSRLMLCIPNESNTHNEP